MVAGLRKLLYLGTDELHGSDVRRVRLCNTGAYLGLLITIFWLAGQLAYGMQEAWINVVGLVAFASVPLLNAKKQWLAARHTLLLWAMSQSLLISILGYGSSSGTHRYLIVIGIGSFLIFPLRVLRWCYLYAAVNFLLVTLVEFEVLGDPTLIPPAGAWLAPKLNLVVFTIFLFTMVILFIRDITRAEAEIERLLLNILPRSIAARLRADEKSIADAIDQASILFADIVGFTPLAARLSAGELVGVLDAIFTRFDAVADELGLEKIKTIGDAYMVASGVPIGRPDHAQAIVEMARRMVEIVAEVSERSGHDLNIRIGINSGPVVAGVIGVRKFAYDLWGDTVNTAARMESHGEAGQIHVTRSTRDALGDEVEVENRGGIEVKGKGTLETFFVR